MAKISYKKAAKNRKALKYGGYMTIVLLFAVVAFVLVNVLFQLMRIKVDLTPESKYTLGATTQLILDDVKDDVTIYGLYVTGNENREAITLVEEYITHCGKLHYTQIDPYKNPEFTQPYKQNNETIDDTSLIVVNQRTGKYKVVNQVDLYDYSRELDYQTYQYKTTITAFKAEQTLTSAIQFVTNEVTPTIHMVTGHGESEIAADVQGLLAKANYAFDQINLLSDTKIDADASVVVVMNNPVQDITEYELETLIDYMQHGGTMILNLSATYPVKDMPKLNSFLQRFGIEPVEGTLIETDPTHYLRYPNLILPEIGKHEITKDVESNTVTCILPIGLNIAEDHNRNLTITPILTTTSKAVSKLNPESTVADYEDGDLRGPFNIGILSEEEIADDGKVYRCKLAVFGSAYMFDNANGYMTAGNYNVLNNTVNYLQSAYKTLYISPKQYVDDSVIVPVGGMVAGGVVFVIVIPVALIAAGVIVWARRKRL